jgi:hypothetical protein
LKPKFEVIGEEDEDKEAGSIFVKNWPEQNNLDVDFDETIAE